MHGLGGSQDVFAKVAPTLGEQNLVCSFDRVNAGLSSEDPGQHQIADSAAELDEVMAALGTSRPVVLVAASFGGEIALMYAGLHPDAVSGIVLIDATLPLEDELTAIDPSVTTIPELRALLDDNPEHVDFYDAYAQTGAVLPNLPDVPITYMTALRHDWPNWEEGIALYNVLLREWVDDLPQGKLVAVDTEHDIQWLRPDTVIAATQDLLDEIR